MYTFWTRFIVFSMLWVLLIAFQGDQIPLGMISFAGAAGFYFLSTMQKGRFVFYILMSIIIILHGAFLSGVPFLAVVLLLYLAIEAAFRLPSMKLYVYVPFNTVLSILLIYLKYDQALELTLLSLLLCCLAFMMNRMVEEKGERREIYDQLLDEYRQLKRMNLNTEKDARLQERTKIARDIHDSVGHRLTALIMKLEMLSIEHGNNAYDELKEMAAESLEETREAVKALQLEENEGLAAVIHLIRKLEAESHMSVQFTMKQGILSTPLSNRNSVILYRVIQEALTNAMRHSQSREVFIALSKSAVGNVAFDITNAVYRPKPLVFGFGLTNMKKRLQEIGGDLQVHQAEGQFIVRGMIPTK